MCKVRAHAIFNLIGVMAVDKLCQDSGHNASAIRMSVVSSCATNSITSYLRLNYSLSVIIEVNIVIIATGPKALTRVSVLLSVTCSQSFGITLCLALPCLLLDARILDNFSQLWYSRPRVTDWSLVGPTVVVENV